jgi:hypothetical protein
LTFKWVTLCHAIGCRHIEALAIRVILEDQLAPVTAIQDVINRAGILDSQLARHGGRMPHAPLYVNIKNRPL